MSTILFPDAVLSGENFLVCFHNKHGGEVILQSERTEDMADHSVEYLNEHEVNNARRPKFFWRRVEDN